MHSPWWSVELSASFASPSDDAAVVSSQQEGRSIARDPSQSDIEAAVPSRSSETATSALRLVISDTDPRVETSTSYLHRRRIVEPWQAETIFQGRNQQATHLVLGSKCCSVIANVCVSGPHQVGHYVDRRVLSEHMQFARCSCAL